MALENQRIIILGGTSGIGFATADAAARDGARVVVVSSSQARVDAAVAALPAGRADGAVVDLAHEDAIERFFARAGAFDHLVYTAGEALTLDALDTLALDAARDAFTLRYWGALAAAKHAHRQIRPGGSIVLTTGIAKDRPGAGWSIAASICGAVDALTRALAVELAPVRVNAVSPGVVRSPLWKDMSTADRDALYRATAERLPVRRVGEPADIAEAYLFLMREGFSTGQVITVDGGTVLV